MGWDLNEVKEEFDDFFATYDASLITDTEHEDRDKLDLELRKTLSLYDQGIQSGKVVTPDDYTTDDKARFQQLYDLAVVAANESQDSSFTRSDDLDNTDEDDSISPIFIIIVVVAALVIGTTVLVVICVICKKKNS